MHEQSVLRFRFLLVEIEEGGQFDELGSAVYDDALHRL